MAQTRTKKATHKRKKQKKINIDLAVISLIVLSILLFVLIYMKSGSIGETLSPFLGGVIGWMKYILPIGTVAIAICLAKDEKGEISSKLIQYIIALIAISTIMSIFQISKGNLNVDDNFEDVINEAYYLGERNVGGGVIGTAIAIPLVKMLGIVGAVILSCGIAVVLVVFMFGLEPTKIFKEYMQEREERKQEMAEYEYEEDKIKNIKQPKNKKQDKVQRSSIDIPIDDIGMENQIKINLNEKPRSKIQEIKEEILGENKKQEITKPDEIEAN